MFRDLVNWWPKSFAHRRMPTSFVPIRLIQWHVLAEERISNAQIPVAQVCLVFRWNAIAYRRRGAGPITTTHTTKARLKIHKKGRKRQNAEFRSYSSAGKSNHRDGQRCSRASSAQIRYRQH